MSNDLRLAQLLCSRLCHDLVGPAGAVNAGLELAEEGEMDGDALELVTSSAAEVTRRLAFFRIAFGAAGGKASAVGTLSLNEARELAEEMLAGGKATVTWPESSHAPDSLAAGVVKVLLLMILLASESGRVGNGGRRGRSDRAQRSCLFRPAFGADRRGADRNVPGNGRRNSIYGPISKR